MYICPSNNAEIIKNLGKMKNQEKFNKAFNYFKKSYAYKMGGTQIVVLPNRKEKEFDDRQYYSGRGAKYNSSIKHDEIGIVKVTRKDYSAFLKLLKDQEKTKELRLKEQEKKEARLLESINNGVYSLKKYDYGTYVELSNKEVFSHTFDAKRLAKTLQISVKDAELLNSVGKTYVFAKSKNGKTYQLYHPSLSCNDLSIRINEVTEDVINQFDPVKWQNAPFAHLVGQTSKNNHFVC